MKFIPAQNKFLEELEKIALTKTGLIMASRQRILTLKAKSSYLEINQLSPFVSGDSPIEYIAAGISQQIEEKRLNSVTHRFIKRCCDLIGALIGLMLTIPFWLIIPILIKIDT